MRGAGRTSSGAMQQSGRQALCRQRYLSSLCASYGFLPRKSGAGGAPHVLPSVGLSAPIFLSSGRVIRARNFSLALRRQPPSDALREGSERGPVIGRLHGPNHGAAGDREVVKDSQE